MLQVFSFSGYSMYPAIRSGDILITREAPARSVRPGDVVCLPRGRAYLAHRVISVKKDASRATLITKGDNMITRDPPFTCEQDSVLVVTHARRRGRPPKKLRLGRLRAFLSARNLTFGILKAKAGAIARRFVNA